jgi:hypothetical protein
LSKRKKAAHRREPSAAQLEQLSQMLLDRLKTLHRNLQLLALAGDEVKPLVGQKRSDLIKMTAARARVVELTAQLLACKLLLNAMCPGWEAEDRDLAALMAAKLPAEWAWADLPAKVAPWH